MITLTRTVETFEIWPRAAQPIMLQSLTCLTAYMSLVDMPLVNMPPVERSALRSNLKRTWGARERGVPVGNMAFHGSYNQRKRPRS